MSSKAINTLIEIARDPDPYIERWKRANKRKVIGLFPMNFPAELVAASGALPVVVQDRQEPITVGNNLLTEFYCGYTRSVADQAGKGALHLYDGFLNADHCIQLLGAVDIVREENPEKPVFFEHLIAAMDDAWTQGQVREKIASFVSEVERFTGASIGGTALRGSFKSFNDNRRLLRQIFDARRAGNARFTPRQLQAFVKSSMVMDKDEHSALLRQVMADNATASPRGDDRIKLHLSGHFCHAPRAELFELFEECGAIIVDDDLYHGVRYISTDMDESTPPMQALADWYFNRNKNVPCPTRVQKSVDWDRYLLDSMSASGAEGVIVLMARFCEPHMFYYPELRKTLDAQGIPHLLIETEHEGLPVETLRTRVEAMIERIRRKQAATV
ncbi:MAG: 2-hydroxyacyl-CoA dehydratase subunit D [Panacagrimonas sp.]